MMGSGAEAAHEIVKYLNYARREIGLLKVRLYPPFSVTHFLEALPKTVKKIAVLDRTKESGAAGDPLYLDVVNAIYEGRGRPSPTHHHWRTLWALFQRVHSRDGQGGV